MWRSHWVFSQPRVLGFLFKVCVIRIRVCQWLGLGLADVLGGLFVGIPGFCLQVFKEIYGDAKAGLIQIP